MLRVMRFFVAIFVAMAPPALAEEGAAPVAGASAPPDQTQLFHSGQRQQVIGQDQLKTLGPMASPSQGMVFTPGGNAISPGLIGGQGGRIMLNGMSAGGR